MVRLPESYLSRTSVVPQSYQGDSTRVHGGTRWRNPRLDGGRAHATSTSNYIFEPSLDMIFSIIRIIIIIVILMFAPVAHVGDTEQRQQHARGGAGITSS